MISTCVISSYKLEGFFEKQLCQEISCEILKTSGARNNKKNVRNKLIETT